MRYDTLQTVKVHMTNKIAQKYLYNMLERFRRDGKSQHYFVPVEHLDVSLITLWSTGPGYAARFMIRNGGFICWLDREKKLV